MEIPSPDQRPACKMCHYMRGQRASSESGIYEMGCTLGHGVLMTRISSAHCFGFSPAGWVFRHEWEGTDCMRCRHRSQSLYRFRLMRRYWA